MIQQLVINFDKDNLPHGKTAKSPRLADFVICAVIFLFEPIPLVRSFYYC